MSWRGGNKKITKKNEKKDKKPVRECSIKKAPKKKEDNDCKNDMVASSFDWAPVDFDPQEDFTTVVNSSSTAVPRSIRRIISRGSSFQQDDPPSLRDSMTLSEVDMSDDEIMYLWDSTPIEDEATTTCQMCVDQRSVEISSSPEFSLQLQLLLLQVEEKEQETQEVVCTDTRRSFIDEEYERFKELGEQFKRSGSRGVVSIIPRTLKRKACVARGA